MNTLELDWYQESVIIALLKWLKDWECRHYYTDWWCITLSYGKLKIDKSKPFPVVVIDNVFTSK